MSLNKYAVRFILSGSTRTYIVQDEHSIDAIIQSLELLEADRPDIVDCVGLAMIAKAWPAGAHLADESSGALIDTTRRLRLVDPDTLSMRVAA